MNTIEVIRASEMNAHTKHLSHACCARIDGAFIQSWVTFWNAMSEAFHFPNLPSYMERDYHSYYDLMTDLSWLGTDEIHLFIEDRKLLRKENNVKAVVLMSGEKGSRRAKRV